MAFDPDSITSQKIHDLRGAAEKAWGDDTRHPRYIGHPQLSAGQCYVTSHWLKTLLGGYVGTKEGHYFWVSPDRRYVLDLTGDKFAYAPEHPDVEGMQLDEDDEPWTFAPHQRQWRPGPAMYKRADHLLWRDLRIVSDPKSKDAKDRASLFANRANAVLRGAHVSSYKHSDLVGADPYPGSTDQKSEDYAQGTPIFHDEPDYNPDSDLSTSEYRFVFANNQLHVSPLHSHQELMGHANVAADDNGPVAVGYAQVNRGHVTWSVESNIGLHGLNDVLKDYSDTVGWHYDGMTDSQGHVVDDNFGPKQAMYYRVRKDGHLIMSERPLPHGRRLTIEGKTAYTIPEVGPAREALAEWAHDFGYKLAEYPGGGNFEDKMKNREWMDLYNRGDNDFYPEPVTRDLSLTGDLKCGTCGLPFDSIEALRAHRGEHDMLKEEPIQDGKFPWSQDFDQPLGFGTSPVPNSGETIAKIAVHPVPGYEHVAHYPTVADNSGWYTLDQPGTQFYGAYQQGQLIGYAAVRDHELLKVDAMRPEASVAILNLLQLHDEGITAYADNESTAGLLRTAGYVNVENRRYATPKKNQEPMNMIESPIPFIYDVHATHKSPAGYITIGYAGQTTSDIHGHFTPGGIIEGYYEPGGKVTLIPAAKHIPYTIRTFGNQWYHQFPQMRLTSVEVERPDGKTLKLAANNIGTYIKSLVASDEAAQGAYQALRFAGGKVYAVGGAVRDALRQQIPKDIDLMVSGLPSEQVNHILSQLPGRVDLTGKRFGVYRYKIGNDEVEVALPRQDKYETSRRGEGVITVDYQLPVEKDLERRDFTANSMAVDLDSGQLIDPYGGAGDVEKNLLRTTHPDSFREDPTRLVRALAAHGRFGFNPDERTRHEMEANGHLLRNESPDALNKILDKLFSSHNPAGAIRLAKETGVLQHLFPEVAQNFDFDQQNPHHHYPLGEHLLNVLHNTSELTTDPDVRMAALLHDVGKPASQWFDPSTGMAHYYEGPNGEGADHEIVGAHMAEQRMRELNYPVSRIKRVRHLVQNHMFPAFSSPKGARRFLQRVGDQHADDLLNLRQADMTGKGISQEEIAERTAVQRQRELVDQVRKAQAPTDLSNLAINGNDLISMGVQPGPVIGTVLRQLLDHVVNVPTDNNRERLLQLAQGYIQAQQE